MITLEDAIKHCKDVALSCNDNEKQCALEHVQLMQWLKELRILRKLVKPEYLQEIRGLQKTWGKEEVDFDKEFEEFVVNDPVIGGLVNFNAAMVIAKHFYKLGLKATGDIFVVTRCEGFSDYVEKAFVDEVDAENYCEPFNEDEDSYVRDITKVKLE